MILLVISLWGGGYNGFVYSYPMWRATSKILKVCFSPAEEQIIKILIYVFSN